MRPWATASVAPAITTPLPSVPALRCDGNRNPRRRRHGGLRRSSPRVQRWWLAPQIDGKRIIIAITCASYRAGPDNITVGPKSLALKRRAFNANTAVQRPVFKWLRNILFGRESVETRC